MNPIKDQIAHMLQQQAFSFSDIHIEVGEPMRVRIPTGVIPLDEQNSSRVSKEDLLAFLREYGPDSEDRWQELIDTHAGQFNARFRIEGVAIRAALFNVGGESGLNRRWGLAMRILPEKIPPFEKLGLPSKVRQFFRRESGLVIVTGITGSGKSTTMASAIDDVNAEFSHRIITLEDPIEYIHRNKLSMISQRQLGPDFLDFASGVKQAMRQDPNIMVVGEVTDLASLRGAISAALSGHLVVTSMHTVNAYETVNRIIDLYPPEEKPAVRNMIGQLVIGIISQKLISSIDGTKYHLAHEIMEMNDTIRTCIREDKLQQIPNEMDKKTATSHVLNSSLAQLVDEGCISPDAAYSAAYNPKTLEQYYGNHIRDDD